MKKFLSLKSILMISGVMVMCLTTLPAYGTITLKDMTGRTVILSHPAKRLITTFKPASLCVFSLGLQDRLVGIDTSSRKDRLNRSIYPAVSKITAVGRKSVGLNYETMVSLRPDLVILYAQKDGKSIAKRLADVGIAALIIYPETFKSIQDSLRLIAIATGEPERADRVNGIMDKLLKKINRRTVNIALNQRKTAYFASSRGMFSTATGSMLQDEIFQKAAVLNVGHNLKGYFQNISPEQFIQWNPDIITVSGRLRKSGVLKRLSGGEFGAMRAVLSRKIYCFPSTLAPWDFPSPLSVLGSLWMAKTAYPKQFADINLMKEVDDFHQALFGKTLTTMGGKIGSELTE